MTLNTRQTSSEPDPNRNLKVLIRFFLYIKNFEFLNIYNKWSTMNLILEIARCCIMVQKESVIVLIYTHIQRRGDRLF